MAVKNIKDDAKKLKDETKKVIKEAIGAVQEGLDEVMDVTASTTDRASEKVKEKASVAKKATAEAVKAAKKTVKDVNSDKMANKNIGVWVQYKGLETDMELVKKRIIEQCINEGFKENEIDKLQIYIKPEDFMAYFVINDSYDGKITLF